METQAIQVNENVEVGVITHEGKEFSAYGFVRTSDRLTAYLGENGQLTKWDGTPVGTYRITRTWRTPRSYVSSKFDERSLETQPIKGHVSNPSPDKIKDAHQALNQHYRECHKCSQKINYQIGELCETGRNLHDAWEREFYDKQNWSRQ
jgi:hypothetical protein